MADITKMNVGGTIYDFKDANAARANHTHDAILLTSEDLNSIHGATETKSYYAGSGNAVANKPDGVGVFSLAVLKAATGQYVQILVSPNEDNSVYCRHNFGTSWSNWRKLYDSGSTLPIANGGTGATTAAAARNALGLGNTAGALPIANGGTGATTAGGALAALGAQAALSTKVLATGTTAILGASYKVTATAYGKVVCIEATAMAGRISSSGATSTESGIAITIPSAYRPSVPTSSSYMVMSPVCDKRYGKSIGFVIYADGTVRLLCSSSGAMNSLGADSFCITYVVR